MQPLWIVAWKWWSAILARCNPPNHPTHCTCLECSSSLEWIVGLLYCWIDNDYWKHRFILFHYYYYILSMQNHVAFWVSFAQMRHRPRLNGIQAALLPFVFTGLDFSGTFIEAWWHRDGRFGFQRAIVVSQTIQVGLMLVKCVRIAARARNSRHAHVCGGIHSTSPLDNGVRSNVRQQIVCYCATVWAFYLLCPNFFMVIVHSEPPFLAENLLIQRLIIELVTAFQHNVKRIQWFSWY